MKNNKKLSSPKQAERLNIPSEEMISSFPSLKKAVQIKEASEKKTCSSNDKDDLFAYSGHNDYSSIIR